MRGHRDPSGAWQVRLICCGYDMDGVERFATWDDANIYRNDYINAEGHQRVGILTRFDAQLTPKQDTER